MNCRKCGKSMKIICSSSRSGRGGYSSGTIYECSCGESCIDRGLRDIDWGDSHKVFREELKKILLKLQEENK